MATTAKKAAAPAPGLMQVRALQPIRYNGADYAEQAVFELAEGDAQALIDGGWAEPERRDPAELSLA